jgi:hypothetical protein
MIEKSLLSCLSMKDACGGEAISSVKYFNPSSLCSLIKKAFIFLFTPFFATVILFCIVKNKIKFSSYKMKF